MYCDSLGGGRTGSIERRGIIPLPAPTLAADIVNRYQILGQVPKLFNTVLVSQPKLNDPLDIVDQSHNQLE